METVIKCAFSCPANVNAPFASVLTQFKPSETTTPCIPFPPHDTVPFISAAMTATAAKTNKPVNRNVRMFFPFLIMVKQSVYCYKEKVY